MRNRKRKGRNELQSEHKTVPKGKMAKIVWERLADWQAKAGTKVAT